MITTQILNKTYAPSCVSISTPAARHKLMKCTSSRVTGTFRAYGSLNCVEIFDDGVVVVNTFVDDVTAAADAEVDCLLFLLRSNPSSVISGGGGGDDGMTRMNRM